MSNNARLNAVVRKREALSALAAVQREELALHFQRLQTPLQFADIAFRLGQIVRLHPMLVATAATMLIPSQRHRLLMWSGRLFTLWELFQAVRKQWSDGKNG